MKGWRNNDEKLKEEKLERGTEERNDTLLQLRRTEERKGRTRRKNGKSSPVGRRKEERQEKKREEKSRDMKAWD